MFSSFQIAKIAFPVAFCLLSSSVCGQDSVRKVLEPDFYFRYDLERIEDPEDGIKIFDQYCTGLSGEVKIREDIFNHVLDKQHIDYYGNGKVLHEGYYEAGSLIKFRNFYPNEQVERELKVKKGKPKLLTTYYMFGEIRERRVFDDGILMLHEKFHYSGKLKYLMEISDVGYLKIEQWNNKEGMPLKYIELKDVDSLIYEIAEMYPSGAIKEKGTYIYDPVSEKYSKHGSFKEYSDKGELVADIYFEDGSVDSVVVDERNAKIETTSLIPADYIAFDLDSNGEISKREVDEAINVFFDEDSQMTLSQLNGLVDFFFDQDW